MIYRIYRDYIDKSNFLIMSINSENKPDVMFVARSLSKLYSEQIIRITKEEDVTFKNGTRVFG